MKPAVAALPIYRSLTSIFIRRLADGLLGVESRRGQNAVGVDQSARRCGVNSMRDVS
ncbi:MAG: hypothetical protein MI923_28325 [Phycisphaerales bacterium]|nr:hypothetical protein [Phycisphaerales bacterium]